MSTEVLHIGLKEIGGTRVLRLTGELDAFTSNRLAAISDTWINGADKIVVNLDGLQYIDSSGLSALVWIWVEARDRGAQLVLTCNNPRIHRILEITGLQKIFTVDATGADSTAGRDLEYSKPAAKEVELTAGRNASTQFSPVSPTRRA